MPATTQPSLADIFDAMEESMRSLEGVLETLTPAEWQLATGCPGWTVHDVASHVIGVECDTTGVARPEHALPDDLGHVRDAKGKSMEVHVDYRRGLPDAEVLAEFKERTRQAMASRRASSRDPEELADGPFGWKMPYARLMMIRTFDCFAHEQDVRRAVGQPGNLEGKAASVVGSLYDEMLSGLLASRVTELASSSITIEVLEPAPSMNREIRSGTGDEAARIRLPFSELVAYVCGRADARRDLVEIIGDEAIAEKALSSLAVTP
jgi:uncharacterized protein (TIGR03083 family)